MQNLCTPWLPQRLNVAYLWKLCIFTWRIDTLSYSTDQALKFMSMAPSSSSPIPAGATMLSTPFGRSQHKRKLQAPRARPNQSRRQSFHQSVQPVTNSSKLGEVEDRFINANQSDSMIWRFGTKLPSCINYFGKPVKRTSQWNCSTFRLQNTTAAWFCCLLTTSYLLITASCEAPWQCCHHVQTIRSELRPLLPSRDLKICQFHPILTLIEWFHALSGPSICAFKNLQQHAPQYSGPASKTQWHSNTCNPCSKRCHIMCCENTWQSSWSMAQLLADTCWQEPAIGLEDHAMDKAQLLWMPPQQRFGHSACPKLLLRLAWLR